MIINALVLAAGLGTRMGSINKMLYQINGQPMLAHTLNHLMASEIGKITVVLGHEASFIQSQLSSFANHVDFIVNPNYSQGMSTSIAAGIHNQQMCDGCLICLGDMPFISSMEYNQIILKFTETDNPDQIVVPTFAGQAGHPVLFGQAHFAALKNLVVSDQGAKRIIHEHHQKVIFLPMQNDHILLDIDKPKMGSGHGEKK